MNTWIFIWHCHITNKKNCYVHTQYTHDKEDVLTNSVIPDQPKENVTNV